MGQGDNNDEKGDIYEEDKKKNCNIGSGDACQGGLLTISFHVHSMNEIKCYLNYCGQLIRVWPKDIMKILERIVDTNVHQNKIFLDRQEDKETMQKRIKYMEDNIKDIQFDLFRKPKG